MKSRDIWSSLTEALSTAKKWEDKLETIAVIDDHIEKTRIERSDQIRKRRQSKSIFPKSNPRNKIVRGKLWAVRYWREWFDQVGKPSWRIANFCRCNWKEWYGHEKIQSSTLYISEFRKKRSMGNNEIEFDKNIFGRPKLLERGGSGNVFSGKMEFYKANSNEKRLFDVAAKEIMTEASE